MFKYDNKCIAACSQSLLQVTCSFVTSGSNFQYGSVFVSAVIQILFPWEV